MSWFAFRYDDFALSFLSILFEGIPFLLAGTLLSGVIDAFLPARVFERFNPRRPVAGIFAAALLPMILPMCECGVVPVARRLIRKGFPPACAVAYLISAPIVNPVVAASTFAAFNGGLTGGNFFWDSSAPGTVTVLRLFLGFVLALLAASVAMQFEPRLWLARGVLDEVGRRADGAGRRTGATVYAEGKSAARCGDSEGERTGGFLDRAVAAVRCAVTDFLDVAVYLVIGAALTAVFNTGVDHAVIEPVAGHPVAATGAMMGFAFALALCSTSDAFVAATFTMFPMASKLAFLVFGPVADVKLFFLYSMLARRRVVAGFMIAAFFVVGAMSLKLSEVIG